MSASESSNLKLFTIFAADTSGKQVDISPGVAGFYYYEDIFSPTVTASVTFMDTGNTAIDGKVKNIVTGLPLKTNETCEIEYVNQSDQTLKFKAGNLFVSKVTGLKREENRQVVTLNFISAEAFTNEFSRVKRRLPPVSTTSNVNSIIKTELQSNKQIFSDQSSTQMAWQGNQRKPFTVIMSLASRSVASNGQAPGFVFYETSRGFNYRSLESLSAQEPSAFYKYSNVNDTEQLPGGVPNAYKILDYSIEKNNDVIEALNLGLYASVSYVFDPLRGSITKVNNVTTSGDLDNKIEKIGKDKLSPEGTLGTNASRIFVGVRDIGNGALNRTNKKDINIEPDDYLSSSPIRYNTLLRHIINIVVPSNFNLHAGDMLKIDFPEVDKNEEDKLISGRYLIKELCHFMGVNNQSLTYLKIVRDTYNA